MPKFTIADLDDLPTVALYTKLADLVFTRPEILNVCPVGNQIRYDKNETNPQKRNVASADLPEIQLVPDGYASNLTASSGNTNVTFRYQFLMSSGDFRFKHYLAPVTWYVISALSEWCEPTIGITGLQWNSQNFVKNLSLIDATDGVSDSRLNRGIEGFSEILRFEVLCYFTRTSLKRA